MEKIQEIIEEIKAEAKKNFLPIVRDNTLKHLNELISQNKPKKVLEIGTAVGYSGLNILLSGGKSLTTIEKNEERFNQAVENFNRAGMQDAVRAIKGDAIAVLQQLKERSETFDFVFLDGPKGQYIKYLPLVKSMMEDGAILFADNVGVLGLVAHSELVTHKNRTMVRNMKAFINQVEGDDDFSTNIYDVDDGYAICVYKQKNGRKI